MKKARYTRGIIAFLLLIVMLTSTAFAAARFSDVPTSHWAYTAITKMANNGYLNGYTDGKFHPNDTMTYGQYFKVISYVFGSKGVGYSKGSNWAYQYYQEAYYKNWFDTSDMINANKLDKPISRQMAFKILLRAQGINVYSHTLYDTTDYYFKDFSKIESTPITALTQQDYAYAAYLCGLCYGDGQGRYNPTGSLTRAEGSTIIYRAKYVIKVKSNALLPNVLKLINLQPVAEDAQNSFIPAMSNLTNIPTEVLNLYYRSGWKTILSKNGIVNTYGRGLQDTLGTTDYQLKTIQIAAKGFMRTDGEVIVHEMGHFLDKNVSYANRNTKRSTAIRQETNSTNAMPSNYPASSNDQEVYARSFALYCNPRTTVAFQKKCPKLTALIKADIASIS